MSDNYGTIAGIIPDSTDEVELWACPAGTQLVSGIIHICNIDTKEQVYDIFATGVTGIAGNCPIVSSNLNKIEGVPQQIGISLSAGQTIRVKSGEADKLSFALIGLTEVADA